jgi:prolyl-tRNA editing enzyme YbaK/EbsC (Cys-tRNA(Pro) deacylase)
VLAVATEELDEKVRRVVAAGAERGIVVEPVTFERETRTAADAAREVGCDVAQIVKTLVFAAGSKPILLLVSGRNRVDPTRAADAAGVASLARADAESARAATGFSIGATPPFGHPTELTVLMDRDLLDHDVVWAAAGRPDSVFPVAPAELARAAGATICDLKE